MRGHLHERRKSEIGHFDPVRLWRVSRCPVDQDVLWLQIAVRDAQRVAEGHTAADLTEDVTDLGGDTQLL